MHAMCAAMDQRYESATDLLADLEEFRKDPGVVFDFSAPPAVSERTQVLKTVSDAALRRVAHEKKPVRRQQQAEPEPERREQDGSGRLAVVAGVIAVLLVVAGLLYFVYATFLKDLLAVAEELKVPQLVGKHLEDVQGNPAYTEDFSLEISNANDGAEAGLIISQDPQAGTPIKKGGRVSAVVSLGPAQVAEQPRPVLMPELSGQPVADAQQQMTGMDFTCQLNHESHETVPEGIVIATEPVAGTALQPGQIIILHVSDGPPEKLLRVPSLRGLPIEEAKARVAEEGFTVEPVVVGYDESDLEKDVVTFQSIDPTVEVAAVTVISVFRKDRRRRRPPWSRTSRTRRSRPMRTVPRGRTRRNRQTRPNRRCRRKSFTVFRFRRERSRRW